LTAKLEECVLRKCRYASEWVIAQFHLKRCLWHCFCILEIIGHVEKDTHNAADPDSLSDHTGFDCHAMAFRAFGVSGKLDL
jgi:hypothetical protein